MRPDVAVAAIDPPLRDAARDEPVEPGPARPVLFYALASLALVAAIFQNFYRLSRAPLLIDEGIYSTAGWTYLHWPAQAPLDTADPANNFEHPPLAKLLFGLAQVLAGHPSFTASRAVAATCTVATAVVLGGWLGRVVNRWVGLAAGTVFALIPMSVLPELTRFGRTAMLDPVASLFVVSSIALSWFWFRRTGWPAFAYSIATGVCIGLASASKENGFLGALVPIGLGLVLDRRAGPRARLARVAQSGVAVLAALATFVGCYLPLRDPFGRILYLVRFQLQHSHDGHLIGLAGQVTARPPWWAIFWFAGQGLGLILSVGIVVTAAAAVVLRRDRLVDWLLAALVGPFVFHVLIAGVVLPFYWTLWMPPVLALSALGGWELLRLARRLEFRTRIVATGLLALAVGACFVVPIGGETQRVVQLQPEGVATVPAIRAAHGLTGEVLAAGTYILELTPVLGSTTILTSVPADLTPIDMILVGQPRCRTLVDPGVRALIRANPDALVLVRTDRLLKVYVVVGPLHAPSGAEIAVEPKGDLTDNC